jgi:urease accessory protein UreH
MDSARAAVRPIAFGQDVREAGAIGRRARLDLRFAVRNGRTVLAQAYAEPPFRVGRCFPDGPEGESLHMIMASSAPGVFGGDCLEQVIHVEEGATVRLTSQSATQVHSLIARAAALEGSLSSRGPQALLRSRYVVGAGASLTCLWDPLIPFPDSGVDQRSDVHIEDGGRLFWSDAFMAGREARGERWQFASLAHELRVSRGGVLAYLERYRVAPSERDVSHPWIASDACYFGTTLVSDHQMGANAAGHLHADLAQMSGVHAAVDLLDEGFLLARLMGSSGVPFHAARKRAAQCSRLRRSGGLSPEP